MNQVLSLFQQLLKAQADIKDIVSQHKDIESMENTLG